MKSLVKKLGEKYTKIVEKRPFIESIITISYTMIFALAVVLTSKLLVGEKIELMPNEVESSYYLGNYDDALEEYSKKESDKKWPIWTVKRAEIYSLKGEKALSNSLLEKAYRQRCELIKKKGQAKYEEEDRKLGNYITFTYLMNGEYEKAEQYGEDFLKTDSDNEKLKETMISVYLAKGEKEKAENILEDINLDDTAYDISIFANLNLIVDNNDEIYELIKKSFEKDNNDIRLLDVIDQVTECKEEDTISQFENHYNEDKNSDMNKIFISRVYSADENKLEEASNIIDSVSDENRDCLLVHAIKIDINKKLNKDYKDNIEYLKEEFEDNYGANYIIAEDYLKDENFEKTIEYGMKCLKLNGEYSKVYGELFNNMLIKQNNIEAIPSYLRRSMYYEPFNYNIIENTAKFYDESKQDIETAYDYYKLASKIEEKRANNYYNMAVINIKKEDDKSAIENLEHLVSVDNSNDEYYNLLGAYYLKHNNMDKAIENLKKAYNINKNNIKVLNNAAIYYAIHVEDIGRAYENIKAAEELKGGLEELLIKSSIKSNYDTIKSANEQLEDGNYKKIDISQVEILY